MEKGKPLPLYKFRVFALRKDGTLGLHLGYVYSYTFHEARAEAQALYNKKHFKFGVEVIRDDVN
jgi:hypothetical protein